MPKYPQARKYDIVRDVFDVRRAVRQIQLQSAGPSHNSDAWHPLVYQNGWADSGAGVTGKYRLVGQPPNEIEILGDLAVPSPANVLIATLDIDANGLATNYGVGGAQHGDFKILASTGSPSLPGPSIVISGNPATVVAVGVPSGTTRGYIRALVSMDA